MQVEIDAMLVPSADTSIRLQIVPYKTILAMKSWLEAHTLPSMAQ